MASPYSPLRTEAIIRSSASATPMARAEKNDRRRWRPRLRKASFSIWIMGTSNVVQRFGRVTPRRLKSRDDGRQRCDDRYRQPPAQQPADPPARVHLVGDERGVARHAGVGGEVQS